MSDWTIHNGVLQQAEYIHSPNADVRPDPDDISLLVIHNISLPPGQFGGGHVQSLFTNKLNPELHPFFREIYTLQVSSHLLIERSGKVIQFVPFHQRAWHAGKSAYKGRERCNDFAIGIEMESTDDSGCTAEQYRVLKDIAQLLVEHYPLLQPDALVGHSDIAPGRKTDPGAGFDWGQLQV
ncbi:1,6-anhydro-N-acetylmuramyl-L-alanine amidase AmpD [Endozoicomonadaceae bacterium StTr2]